MNLDCIKGRRVMWTDENGGWHTGETIGYPDCSEVAFGAFTLVCESCNRVLTWAPTESLRHWPSRAEWERS